MKHIAANIKLLLVCFLAAFTYNLKAQPSPAGSIDTSFNTYAINNPVYSTSIQSDGKIIIGGAFTSCWGVSRNHIARLNTDGGLDTTFNVGTGADNHVFTTSIQSDGKIIIGGNFNYYNGTLKESVARLNTDGSLDTSFNVSGGFYHVLSISIQSDGKIIIGGAFATYNGAAANYIARLNIDGSLDTSFNVDIGANSVVRTTRIQSDGKVIVGGDFNEYNGIVRNYIVRLNTDGSIDTSFNIGTGANEKVSAMAIQNDGKIIIGGEFTTYNGIGRIRHARLNTDGSLDTSFNVGTGVNRSGFNAIAIQSNGKIVIGGEFTTYNGIGRIRLARLNTDGSLDTSFNVGSGADNSVWDIAIQSDDKIIIVGQLTLYNGTTSRYIARVNPDPQRVYGYAYNDLNQDCLNDVNETGIPNRRVLISDGSSLNFVTQTNINGYWSIDSLPSGTYTAAFDTLGHWRTVCPTSINFNVINPDNITQAPDFGLISTQPCASPDVAIHTPFLRRCFSNQNVFVNACNKNIATGALNNAYVELQLDSLLIPQSASLPYTALGNNIYRFDVGNLNPGMCADFYVSCSLSCAAALNQTLCMNAVLFPNDSCVFDTTKYFPEGVAPCNSDWDKSNLRVWTTCSGNEIRFVIYNTGDGNMNCYSPVRVYVDGQMVAFDSVLIAKDDSVVYTYAADGRTWRMEVDQHPAHPGLFSPNATIENCGNSSNWTPNLVNILPHDDADPIIDIYCGLVTGSYDPNDKTGYPLGLYSQHYIKPNQAIEYVIRFQNTGTDTAFTVVIRDTLSSDLDIFSVASGVSSHEYTFRMYGPRVLEWTFNNILLPDSNVNEPASNGFVVFTVNQAPHLPNNTPIENSASIYFDYNAPIITNTSQHTVNDMLQTPTWTSQISLNQTSCDSYMLNNLAYNNSGTYYQRKAGSGGADTIVTLNLTINTSNTVILNESACNEYTFDGQSLTQSGTYTQNLTNTNGCDSTITLNLTINNDANTAFTATSCGNYILNGQSITQSGIYYDTILTLAGCDSVITLDVTVNNLPQPVIVQKGGDLVAADSTFITYEWLLNGQPAGGNDTSYTFNQSGNYTLQVTDSNGCIGTSNSIYVTFVGIGNNQNAQFNLIAYPNPFSQTTTIQYTLAKAANTSLKIYDVLGKELMQTPNTNQPQGTHQIQFDNTANGKGIYIIELTVNVSKTIKRIVQVE